MLSRFGNFSVMELVVFSYISLVLLCSFGIVSGL